MKQALLIVFLAAILSSCSWHEKRTEPGAGAAPGGGSSGGSVPLPGAPALGSPAPVPASPTTLSVTLPTTLTLTMPTTTPLTQAQLESFDAFVQAQGALASFTPDFYIFNFAQDETALNGDQGTLLANLRNAGDCTTANNLSSTAITTAPTVGTQANYTNAYGFTGGNCYLLYSANEIMDLTYEDIDSISGAITLTGLLSSSKQSSANSFAAQQIGFAQDASAMAGNSVSLQTNAVTTNRFVKNLNVVVTGADPSTSYNAAVDADVLYSNDNSSNSQIVSTQLATNITLSSPSLATPVTFSLLSNVNSTLGVVTSATQTGYLNGTQLDPATLTSFLSNQLFVTLVNRIGRYGVSMIAAAPSSR